MSGLRATLVNYAGAARARWQAMPQRDQRALAALTLFFVLVSGWLFVVAPVLDYAGNSRTELERVQADFAWMQANAGQARQAGSGASQLAPGQSLLSVINASAQESGLNLQRFEPDGDSRVRVTLENAVFTDVMRWIVLLQQRYGIGVDQFNADPQAQPGVVNIRLTLGRPA